MNRRTFVTSGLATLAAPLLPRVAHAIGEADRFTIARLDLGSGGNFDPRPTALRRLILEVEKRTSIAVDPMPPAIDVGSKDLFTQPFAMLVGDRKFAPLPDEDINNLRTYLKSGGFLFVDSAEGVLDGPYIESVRRMLERAMPDKRLAPIPSDHVLYKSFFLLDKPVGRIAIEDKLWGIFDDDRLAVVLSQNDAPGAWARDSFGTWTYECSPGGERQRELAYRLGINLVLYALCINYKADQVHVPFILKRRKWRIE
jgi:hypothetical protein